MVWASEYPIDRHILPFGSGPLALVPGRLEASLPHRRSHHAN